jgi:phage tail-like protein
MVGYREGGMNTHPHKFIGQSDFAPVNFSRGVFEKQDQLYKWQQFMHSWNQASGASDSSDNNYRCDIFVEVFDHPVAAGKYAQPNGGNQAGDNSSIAIGSARWGFKLFNCWPGAYSLSDLSAGDSGIIIQQLTVHHEGFVVGWNPDEVTALKAIS